MKSLLVFLWHAGAALFWLGAVFIAFLYTLFKIWDGPCSLDEHSRLANPDSDLVAVVSVQNCGAMTNWRGIVTINDEQNTPLRTVLTLEGHPRDSDFAMEWHDAKRLLLSDFSWNELVRVYPPKDTESRFSVSYRAKQTEPNKQSFNEQL